MLAVTESLTAPPQARLQSLIHANRAIVAELSLDALLARIVESAREIADAQYAALGVVAPDGSVEQFIHCGMDSTTVTRIGREPEGRGVLGALLEDGLPINVASVAEDARSCGVPPGHPPITAFLGVPIRSASSTYGNLYLANPRTGPVFSAEDQALVQALAATASIAVENARLYEQSRRRAEWQRASAEVSQRLLAAEGGGAELLDHIVGSIRRLAAADTVCLSLPVPDAPALLELAVTSGQAAAVLRGLRYDGTDSIASDAMREGRGLVLNFVGQRLRAFQHLQSALPVTHAMALPLKGEGPPRGALLVLRVGQHPFSDADLEMATAFASQATLALELADARADHQKLVLLEDRARIARDLHDHVVQKLFGAGLTIQGTATMLSDPQVRERLAGTIHTLDDAIRGIRSSIFELQDLNPALTSVRSRVLAVLAEVTPVLGFSPELQFDGPLDTMVDEGLAVEVEAVLRESLTNVAKHARATSALVEVSTNGRLLMLSVADDGVGLGPSKRRSGLSNLRRRAERRGGLLELDQAPEGGLLVRWTIPLG